MKYRRIVEIHPSDLSSWVVFSDTTQEALLSHHDLTTVTIILNREFHNDFDKEALFNIDGSHLAPDQPDAADRLGAYVQKQSSCTNFSINGLRGFKIPTFIFNGIKSKGATLPTGSSRRLFLTLSIMSCSKKNSLCLWECNCALCSLIHLSVCCGDPN